MRNLLHRHALTRPNPAADGPADASEESLAVQRGKQPETLPHAKSFQEIATLVGKCSLDVEDDDGLDRYAREIGQLGDVLGNNGRVGLRDDGNIHGRSPVIVPEDDDRSEETGNSKTWGHCLCGQPAIGAVGTSRPDARNGYREGSSQTNRYRI